jgi:hypothetical protein
MGYLPHSEAFNEGGYEVETAPFFFGLPRPGMDIHERILLSIKNSSIAHIRDIGGE